MKYSGYKQKAKLSFRPVAMVRYVLRSFTALFCYYLKYFVISKIISFAMC